MTKGSIHQENIVILNTYASNYKVSTFIKQKLIQLKIKIDTSSPQLQVEISTCRSQQMLKQVDKKSVRTQKT